MIDWTGLPTQEGIPYFADPLLIFDYPSAGTIVLASSSMQHYSVIDWGQNEILFPLMATWFGSGQPFGALLSGSSDLTATARATGNGLAAMTGSSSLTARVKGVTHLSTLITGTGTLTPVVKGKTHLSALMTGTGSVSPTLRGYGHLSVRISSTGTLVAVGNVPGTHTLQALISGMGTLTASAGPASALVGAGTKNYSETPGWHNIPFRYGSKRQRTKIGGW